MHPRWGEVEITVDDGRLAIRPDGDAKLEFGFTARYSYDFCDRYDGDDTGWETDEYYDDYDDYDSYDGYDGDCEIEYSTDYLIDTAGEAEDFDGDEFELELEGDVIDADGYGYWAEFDLDCRVGGQVMKCDGRLRLEGYSQRVELEFKRTR